MPVRFLVYVSITALTRMMIGDIQAHHEPDIGIIYISGAILLLAIANLVIRYGSAKYPAAKASEEQVLNSFVTLRVRDTLTVNDKSADK